MACAGQLRADGASDSCLAAMEFISTVALGMTFLRQLLQYVGVALEEQLGAVYLRAGPLSCSPLQGLSVPGRFRLVLGSLTL